MSKADSKKFELTKENIRWMLAVGGVVTLLVYGFIFLGFKDTVIVLGMIFFGALSRMPQRIAPMSIGFEFCTLFTVCAAIMYGATVGAIVGFSSTLASAIYTRERPQDVLVMLVGFILIGIFGAPLYKMVGFGWSAVILTATYDLVGGIFWLMFGHMYTKTLLFAAIHVPSNYVILRYLGPKILGLM